MADVLSTLITAAAIVLVVAVSVRGITRPLRHLADAADRPGRGETVPEIAEEGPEEIRRTTHAFNAMQARVRRFVDDRTRMLAAMSHDLRTPLTAPRCAPSSSTTTRSATRSSAPSTR